MNEKRDIEDIAKRRGFFWRSSSIYGGISGLYDYAHLGKLLKNKWESLWKSFFLSLSDDYYEIEGANIMPEKVFVASGHLESFVDPMARCKKCKAVERADQILNDVLNENFDGLTMEQMNRVIKEHKISCQKCGGELEDLTILNMMFPVTLGIGGNKSTAYLRPETAQSAYVNFKEEFEALRKRLPMGLAIIGKAFRNEISPRNALFRQREFTQAELQIFFDQDKVNEHEKFNEIEKKTIRIHTNKDEDVELTCNEIIVKLGLPKFYVYHMAKIQEFYLDILKISRDKFRFRQLSDEEKAFYNKYHFDIELSLESLGGFKEVAGLHYRTDHDLVGHQKISSQSMVVNVDGKKVLPHVLELSFGVDRNVYALLELAYDEELVDNEPRVVLRFPKLVSPYDAGIFPLVKKDGLAEKAREVQQVLKDAGFIVFYDESGSIGRRYRRQDEVGSPCGITIDYDTMSDNSVTLRDRDTMKQVRVPIKELQWQLRKFLHGEKLEALGKLIDTRKK
ncbi:MAG: glycine--tRNA ligase [Candidatus Aenigmatarchaeota archaeon]